MFVYTSEPDLIICAGIATQFFLFHHLAYLRLLQPHNRDKDITIRFNFS